MGESDHILVIDDETGRPTVRETMLVKQGYEVWHAQKGDQALDIMRSGKIDLALLDITLPDMVGIDLCREIRAISDAVIIVLAARGEEWDQVVALDAGADDYVIKPIDASVLLARIRAKLRRHKAKAGPELFTCSDFVIDFAERTVTRQEKKIGLSPKQWELLRCLASCPGKSLSHRTLLQLVWGSDYAEETGLLQAHIVQIRKKIEPEPGRPRYLVTVPWFGYRFQAPLPSQMPSKTARSVKTIAPNTPDDDVRVDDESRRT